MGNYAHLAGHRFPGGSYTLPEYVAWLWADAALAEPDAATAHPSLGYFVAMQGAGIDIASIFELMDASADSGVVFGELALRFDGVLRPGARYDVEGEIESVERKTGRRSGAFDKLTFVLRVRDSDSGQPVVSNTNTWIFPRKDA